jgi:Tudor domain
LKSKIDVEEDLLPRLPISKPEIGTLVHIEVNKKMLRGSIVAARDTKFKVQLVDYGRILVEFVYRSENLKMKFIICRFPTLTT